MKKVIFLVSVLEVDSDAKHEEDVVSASNTTTKVSARQLLEALGNGDLDPDGSGDETWEGILKFALDRVDHADALRLMADEQGENRLEVQDDLSLKDLDEAKRMAEASPAGKLASEIYTFVNNHKKLMMVDGVGDLLKALGGKKRKPLRDRVRAEIERLAVKPSQTAITDLADLLRAPTAPGTLANSEDD